MFCSKCGTDIPDTSRFCHECGEQLSGGSKRPFSPGTPDTNGTRDQFRADDIVYPKNPPLSPHFAWLSLVMPGLPQLVFGQVFKGIVCCIAFFLSFEWRAVPAIIVVASVIDAYMVGKTLKAGIPVKKWHFFPKP